MRCARGAGWASCWPPRPLALLLGWTRPAGPSNLFYEDDKSKNTSMMMLLLKSGNYEGALAFYDQLRAAIGVQAPKGPATAVPAEDSLEAKLAAIDEAFTALPRVRTLRDDRAERHLELGFGFSSLLGLAERYERTEVTLLAREQFELALAPIPTSPARTAASPTSTSATASSAPPTRAERRARPARGRCRGAPRRRMIQLEIFKDDLHALQHFRTRARPGPRRRRRACWPASGASRSTTATSTRRRCAWPARCRRSTIRSSACGTPERALELLPDDPIVIEYSADVLYANGQYDRAVKFLRRLATALP